MQPHARAGTATKVEKVEVLLATSVHALVPIRWWPTRNAAHEEAFGAFLVLEMLYQHDYYLPSHRSDFSSLGQGKRGPGRV